MYTSSQDVNFRNPHFYVLKIKLQIIDFPIILGSYTATVLRTKIS